MRFDSVQTPGEEDTQQVVRHPLDSIYCYHVMMASTRTTITLDAALAERARELGVNISAAARAGVAAAVRAALAESDRAAYARKPERPDPAWDDAEAWSEE